MTATAGAGEARAQIHTLDIVSIGDATVSARGLLLTVPVTITCGPEEEQSATIGVELRQRVGQRIATAFAEAPVELVCDNTPHTYFAEIPVSQFWFRPGHALARASSFACFGEELFCVFDVTGFMEIRVRQG